MAGPVRSPPRLVLVVSVLLVACHGPAAEVLTEAGAPAAPPGSSSAPASSGPSAATTAAATTVSPAPEAAQGTTASFALGPLPPNAPFEGRLTIRISAPGKDDPDRGGALYKFTVKGHKSRWDLFSSQGKGTPTGFRIYDADQRKFFTVMTQPYVYVTDEAALLVDAGTPPTWKFTPNPLTTKSKIHEIPCDLMQTTNGNTQYDVCVAPVAAIPLEFLGPAAAVAAPFGTELAHKGLFPMNVLARTAGRGPMRSFVGKLTVEEVERGAVPAEAFILPDYPQEPATTLAISTHLLR